MLIEKATEFSRDFELQQQQDRVVLLNKAIEFLKEEVRETEEAIKANDREEIIDGFGDVAFIAINGIYKEFRSSGDSHTTATTKTKEVLNRICNANLGKKHPDGTIKYNNGKVQKPDGWMPPQYKDIL